MDFGFQEGCSIFGNEEIPGFGFSAVFVGQPIQGALGGCIRKTSRKVKNPVG